MNQKPAIMNIGNMVRATSNDVPMKLGDTNFIDTGAVFGGILSIVKIN